MKQEFPVAVYGKSPEPDGSDQYRLLGRSSDFPQEALAEFEKLAGAIQWSGGGGNRPYPACYAAWPVGKTGAIVARLTDSGTDHLNRPHTLRIEGVWVGKDQISDWRSVISELLQGIAWLERSLDSVDVPLQLSLGHSNHNLGANVVTALKNADPIPSILIANHKNYRSSGFEIIQDPNQPNGVYREILDGQEFQQVPHRVTVQQNAISGQKPRVWLPYLLFVVCLLLIAFGGWEYYSRQQLQSQYNAILSNFAETKSSLEGEIKNVNKLQQDLKVTSKERDQFRAKLQELKGQHQEYTSLLREYRITSNDDLIARLKAFDQAKSDKSSFDTYTKLRLEGRIQSLTRGLDKIITDLERLRESELPSRKD